MKIYMDICCFNRPFDDQAAQWIYLETEAKLFIQRKIKDKKISLIWSYILDFENSANPAPEIMDIINIWRTIAVKIILVSPDILEKAAEIRDSGFGVKDSLHIACSVIAEADYFITVDKGILKKKNIIKDVNIIDPIEFIKLEE